jgi:hypothetical protein
VTAAIDFKNRRREQWNEYGISLFIRASQAWHPLFDKNLPSHGLKSDSWLRWTFSLSPGARSLSP